MQVYTQRKRSKKKDKWESIRCKQANDILEYIVPKSTNESRAQYSVEPVRATDHYAYLIQCL